MIGMMAPVFCRGLPAVMVCMCALALSACGGDSSQNASTAAASATPASSTPAASPAASTTPVTTPVTAPVTTPVTTPVTPPTPPATSNTLAFSAASFAVAQNASAVTVTVKRSGTASAAVSVQYATSDGSAVAGTVYKAASGMLEWAANDMTAKTFAVPVSNTTPFEGSKSFSVVLSHPSTDAAMGAPNSATITVAGDATAGSLQLSAANYSVAANAGSLNVTVSRSGGSAGAVSVAYATANRTAQAGTNYTGTHGTLNWAANDATPKTFIVAISPAAAMTSSATFTVTLSAPGGGAALGATAASTVTITPVTAAAGSAIKVAGNHLVDENGKTVQLRGVNVSGLEFVAIGGWDPSNPWGSQTGDPTPNWTTIKSWGANAVRLPLNEASWLGLSCIDIGGSAGTAGATIKADPGGNYRATVEQSVADATAAGLYVILDLHWAAPNDGATPACPTTQNPMADTDHSVTFWTSLANQFKTNPGVIFELFNEPFLDATALLGNAPWPDLLNGGSVTQFAYSGGAGVTNLTWSTAGMQELLDAVRATGASNVVLSSTLQWSQQMDGWLKYKPTDSAGQLGAVWHPYPSSQYPTQVSCVSDGILSVGLPQCSALEMAAVQAILAAGYPVVATEFGDTIGGSTAPWASVLLPFADANGVSYLGWTWDTWTGDSANVLITDAAGNPTPGYGTYVKQHYLCRAAGTANCP